MKAIATTALLTAVLLLTGCVPAGGDGPAPTDLYLLDIWAERGLVFVGDARNLTERAGWDNQPSFDGGGDDILYSSMNGARADIWRYEMAENGAVQVTDVAKRLYLPQALPGGGGFSVVRRERDDRQRLWRFDDDGGNGALVFEDLPLPVLYYTWVDAETVALSVEEDEGPPALHIGSTVTGELERVAEDVGRSIQRVPGRRAVSFVVHDSPSEWWIAIYDLDIGLVERVAHTVQGIEDHAWLPSGSIISARGANLYRWVPGTSEAWDRIATVEGVREVSRIAVSPAGDRLVIVASD